VPRDGVDEAGVARTGERPADHHRIRSNAAPEVLRRNFTRIIAPMLAMRQLRTRFFVFRQCGVHRSWTGKIRTVGERTRRVRS
jgi:hypothetical protein